MGKRLLKPSTLASLGEAFVGLLATLWGSVCLSHPLLPPLGEAFVGLLATLWGNVCLSHPLLPPLGEVVAQQPVGVSQSLKLKPHYIQMSRASLPCSLIIELLLLRVTLVELLNTSTSCNITLTASEERMALGANINSQLLLGRAGSKGIATTANDLSLKKLWMNSCLHCIHLTFPHVRSITSYLCESLVRLSFPNRGKAEKSTL